MRTSAEGVITADVILGVESVIAVTSEQVVRASIADHLVVAPLANVRTASDLVVASAAMDPDSSGASIPFEELLGLARECSRVCGMSVPDGRLEEYVLRA